MGNKRNHKHNVRLSFSLFLAFVVAIISIAAFRPSDNDADRELAIVLRFIPRVIVQNGQEVVTLELDRDKARKLYDGDTLETGNKGYAQVVFLDKSTAKVKPNSQLIVRGEAGTSQKVFSTRIDLKKGELKLDVTPRGANDFEVSTEKSLASVKGTSFGSESSGYYYVEEGEVEIRALNSGLTLSLFENQFAQVDADGDSIETGELSEDDLNELNDQFSNLDVEFVEKTIILRFRDANGQLREEQIKYYEKQN